MTSKGGSEPGDHKCEKRERSGYGRSASLLQKASAIAMPKEEKGRC